MSGTLRVLLIEDNPGDARLTRELLRDAAGTAMDVVHVAALEPGMARLAAEQFAVVLLDLSLPDSQGLETVGRLRTGHPRLPLIVLSGYADESVALEALQTGAQDYLVKGQGDGQVIARAIRYAIERKRGELQLTEAKELAEAASRTKSTFLAHMSHELRTPLNAVIGFSDIIASGMLPANSDEVCREYAHYIHDSALHLLELVNDILDLSKSLTDHFILRDEPIDLPALLRGCVELVSIQTAHKSITVTVATPPDLSRLTADPLRLKQVILNLLSNAAKFSGEGTAIAVTVDFNDDGDVVIGVQDQGVGMKPEDIPVALEPFRQIDNAMLAQEGTGLGLPLTKLITEKHGGSLTIVSTVGVGTTVYVTLPGSRLERRKPMPLRRSA
ncbi:MAG TPA: HAMP domain-containing sensor histidine kinase [Stellaceae bacterium]|jgi:signal transduction histidine kinase|nr:HAMP domain-containing sensor histidine kinase [Stellaceae bacterium]